MKKANSEILRFPYSKEPAYINFYRYPPAEIYCREENQKFTNEVLQSGKSFIDTQYFSIYISVPFCNVQCNSCPFFKQLVGSQEGWDIKINEYINYVLRQIRGISEYNLFNDKVCAAIYFGGGTASLLTPKQVDILLNTIASYFNLDDNIEITLEGNPIEFTKKYLNDIHSLGINRLSIGLQSFQNYYLKNILNSPHNSSHSYSSIKNALQVGFRTVNVDLLYGLPNQNFIDWEYDMKVTKRFMPQSVTTNRYVVHKGSKSEKFLNQRKFSICDLNINELENWTSIQLKEVGYVENRLGSFSIPGHEQIYSKLTYTLGNQLVGFGVGAYSFVNDYLIESPNSINVFKRLVDTEKYFAINKISKKANKKKLMERFAIMNLMSSNIDRSLFKKRFNTDITSVFTQQFKRLLLHNLIIINEDKILLTEKGKKWKRNIMSEFYSFKSDYNGQLV